jgi:hypothetical protein
MGCLLVADFGIPELSEEQIDAASLAAEEAARKYVFSTVKQKQVANLDITVEAEGSKPIGFTVEVDLALETEVEGFDEKKLVAEAVKAAFAAIESYLRTLK